MSTQNTVTPEQFELLHKAVKKLSMAFQSTQVYNRDQTVIQYWNEYKDAMVKLEGLLAEKK